MEFKSLKNIESSFRQIRLFGIVFLSLCAVITVWSVWSSYRFAERQREKIYVLDNERKTIPNRRICLNDDSMFLSDLNSIVFYSFLIVS